MSNIDDKDNQHNKPAEVIDTNKLSDQKQKISLNETIHQTHDIFIESISPRLKNFFQGLNNFFFDMAEQAENNALQNQYFSAIGETRNNRSALTDEFTQNIRTIFQKFQNQDFIYFTDNSQQTQAKAAIQTLTLIKDDDLDQKLAISNLTNKVSQTHHNELHLLNQRYAELAQVNQLNEQLNPIGPNAIINAFALSLKILDSGNNIKLLIIKLFEDNMVKSLGPAYRMVNMYLKNQGILPDLKLVAKQPAKKFASYMAQKSSGDDENYKKIAGILANDSNNMQSSTPKENIVQFSQLAGALDQIKTELLSNQELTSKESISPLELKDELVRTLKSLNALSSSQQLQKTDENTIDLIGELFQFLVDDRNLPETIQLVLSKLQLPYLQIALKDPTFFSDKQNNARQLLNIIAESAVGWSPQTDKNSIFLHKVKEIVEFILHNHEKTIQYEKLIVRFIQFDQKLKKRANILERRTSAKVSGRERLKIAKNNTAHLLRKNLKGQKTPAIVRDLLLKPWANVLILSELRQQESPELLTKYQKFVIKLIHAANPEKPNKITDHEIKSLCNELSEGLKLVAFNTQDLHSKSKQLQQCLEKINGLKTTETAVEFINPTEVLKLSKEFNEESSIGTLIENTGPNLDTAEHITVIDDKFNTISMNITLGEWLEINITNQNKKAQRVKLSWKSPISGKLLFVNAKGAKVLNIYPTELADKLRTKDFILLKQIPLVDRAMSSIAVKMKKSRQPDAV